MDKDVLLKAIKISIFEVLETMFFTPVDIVSGVGKESAKIDEPDVLAVRLDFKGTGVGFFLLQMPQSLARALSSDFLGIDSDKLTDKDVAGTVQEMVNMLAGNTLSHYDAAVVFDLAVPEMVACNQAGIEQTDQYERVQVKVQTLTSPMVIMVAFKR